MYIDQDQLGLMLVLPVLFLSILIIIISIITIINTIALISSFIKHIMSTSDVIRYQLQAWLPCLSGNDFQKFHSFVNVIYL